MLEFQVAHKWGSDIYRPVLSSGEAFNGSKMAESAAGRKVSERRNGSDQDYPFHTPG